MRIFDPAGDDGNDNEPSNFSKLLDEVGDPEAEVILCTCAAFPTLGVEGIATWAASELDIMSDDVDDDDDDEIGVLFWKVDEGAETEADVPEFTEAVN